MSLAPIGRSKHIKWKIYSKIDPKWGNNGTCYGFVSVTPHATNKHLKKCEKLYGARPKDLRYSIETI